MARNQNSKTSAKSWPWRTWLRVTVFLAALAATAAAARAVHRYVLDDPRFIMVGSPAEAVDSADFLVQGVTHTSRDRILEVFSDDFGKNVLLIPIAERRRQLLAIDWVADGRVSRLWPNRIVIQIRERVPVAFMRLTADPLRPKAARPALIDAEGVILHQPEKGRFSFPVLIGVNDKQPEGERKARVARMQRVLKEMGELPPSCRLSEVDVSARDVRVSVEMADHEVELILGDRDFAARVQRFLTHYPEIRKRSPQYTIFDLRLEKNIIARETE